MLLTYTLACSHAPPETAPVLPPPPVPPTRTTASSWRIPSWTGSSVYRFSQHVVVTSDSLSEKALILDTAGSEIFGHRVTGVANTFTLATTPPRQSKEEVSATLVDNRLVMAKEPAGLPECDASKSRLRAEIFDLALHLPSPLSTRMTWTDSATTDACVGGLPGGARTIRNYAVVGDTAVSFEPAVIVSRRDSANVAADGVLEQHPTVVNGTAVSNVLLYVSTSSGKVLRFTKEQVVQLSVTAEGSTRVFVQRLTSAADLVR